MLGGKAHGGRESRALFGRMREKPSRGQSVECELDLRRLGHACSEENSQDWLFHLFASLQEIERADTMMDGVWQDLESSPAVRDCFWFVWGVQGATGDWPT
jgi:hypothetical protein